jgi:hypothetical protein
MIAGRPVESQRRIVALVEKNPAEASRRVNAGQRQVGKFAELSPDRLHQRLRAARHGVDHGAAIVAQRRGRRPRLDVSC